MTGTPAADEDWRKAVTGADGKVQLSLRAQPGAKRSALVGMHGDRLRIAVKAPPVDGKANAALVAWVAELLDLPTRRVALVAGQASRDKRIEVQATRAEVLQRLGAAWEQARRSAPDAGTAPG